jgi:DNA-binding transcriptional LysR family regulator
LLVTAPILFGKLHVAPIVHAFLAAYPDVRVRLLLSDQLVDLAEAHVDVAVRIGRLADSDLVARQVGHVRWLFCASPDYLARRGTPATAEALSDHDVVAFEIGQPQRSWPVGSGASARTIAVNPRLAVNTADAVVEAAAAGLGIARVMSYQAATAISKGEVIPILAGLGGDPLPVSLLHPAQRVQPLKRRAFLDFVIPRLTEALQSVQILTGAQ